MQTYLDCFVISVDCDIMTVSYSSCVVFMIHYLLYVVVRYCTDFSTTISKRKTAVVKMLFERGFVKD